MKLQFKERQSQTKKEANGIRREGGIPAILYSKGQTNRMLTVQNSDFQAHLRATPKGFLSSKKFILEDEQGKKTTAIIKDIQYHVVTYNVLHIDFLELHEKQAINVKIPLKLKGAMDCAGVKVGGVVRPVVRHLKVKCLPKDIPDHFELDVTEMKLGHSKRLSSIQLPETVRPMVNLDDVAVIIAKR